MSVIRVTKEFHFEMAHALYGYEGKCKNIHGHSYFLQVCVKGEINNQRNNPENGMVMDFSLIKKIITSIVIAEFDHGLMLSAHSSHKTFASGNAPFEKVIFVNYQPTCENILVDIAEKIKPGLPEGVQLNHLHLRETPTSYAEWYAADND